MQSKVIEESQYLTFLSGSEVFGIGILKIKEIKEYSSVTTIPMMPEYVKGVINLRGNVVPIIDLLVRFGRGKSTISKRSCVIIVEVEHEEESIDIGILVDAVNEVVDIPPTSIEPAPSFGAKIRIDFIQGIGKLENQFVILLNVNKVLSISELSSIEEKLTSDINN
ncbi:MAG TPA: chemotaxis protein CheW [Leptospiraceae bacterium]|nr:chemotaxis protein CheW [Leptospiraceae bacterium]HMW05602.1 chemotaxis protein CheW [Leptospiraceae bacterium]HMY31111.1 chemotaxis protein CheW [Leptospiraceae bacterium]HMZ63694.1 chemotaxis protein CheW [Leptospiraceae bacterium]HNA05915.1 chemotaxis protein CheW [Leptospiraceae bacterium]